MVFRVKDHREPRRAQSPAQQAATQRSFRIFRLRGLHSQCLLLTGDRRAAAQAAVDAELIALGVEPQTQREAARQALWARIDADEATRAELEKDLPF